MRCRITNFCTLPVMVGDPAMMPVRRLLRSKVAKSNLHNEIGVPRR